MGVCDVNRKIKKPGGRREAALFARLCDVGVCVIEELCIGDYKKLQEAQHGND